MLFGLSQGKSLVLSINKELCAISWPSALTCEFYWLSNTSKTLLLQKKIHEWKRTLPLSSFYTQLKQIFFFTHFHIFNRLVLTQKWKNPKRNISVSFMIRHNIKIGNSKFGKSQGWWNTQIGSLIIVGNSCSVDKIKADYTNYFFTMIGNNLGCIFNDGNAFLTYLNKIANSTFTFDAITSNQFSYLNDQTTTCSLGESKSATH